MRKIKLKAVYKSHIARNMPLIPASQYRPDWWKKTSPYITKDGKSQFSDFMGVKACPAIHHHFHAGYIVPSPVDFKVCANDFEYWIEWGCPESDRKNLDDNWNIDNHGHVQEQLGHLDISGYVPRTLKISTNINIMADRPCNVMFVNPYWTHLNTYNNFICMNGTMQISNDLYPGRGHEIIPNYLVKKNTETIIKRGDPLLQIIPFEQTACELTDVVLSPDHWQEWNSHELLLNETRLKSLSKKVSGLYKHISFSNFYTKSKNVSDGSKELKDLKKEYTYGRDKLEWLKDLIITK